MATPQTLDYLTVVRAVREWPAEQRFALVRQVLQSLEHDAIPRPRRATLDQALGLAATNRPPPSDEEVEQWLEEERLKKYG